MILVMLFVAVLVIEGISTFLKAYLDGRIKRNTTANVIISVCIMALFVYSLSAVKDVSTSKLGIKVVGAIMHGITHPDWEYMFMTGKSGVMYLMLETIAIAVAGTCAGAVFAVILTLINSRKFVPAPMAFIGRLCCYGNKNCTCVCVWTYIHKGYGTWQLCRSAYNDDVQYWTSDKEIHSCS